MRVFLITLLWKQNSHHKHGVLIHTLMVILSVIKAKDYKLIIPALFHDIGKPFVAYQKPEDIINKEYSFTDHEEKSYQIIKHWPLSNLTKNIIRHHYLIRKMVKGKRENDINNFLSAKKVWLSLSLNEKILLKRFLKHDDNGK